MSAESIATEIATAQGWTDTTLLDLALTYIDRQGSNDAFADYLRQIAHDENSEAGDQYDDAIDEEGDEMDDAFHDGLHSAAESYASNVNNGGPDAQRAFLLASGLTEQQIADGTDGDGDDALDMLVIDTASLTASRAYNNNGTPESVTETLLSVYDPHGGHAESPEGAAEDAAEDEEQEEEFGPYDWTCTYCGSGLNENNFDRTGSRKCYDDNHSEHLDEGAIAEFEDESHG